MKQFTDRKEIQKLNKTDLLETLQTFTPEEKHELKEYLADKMGESTNGATMFLNVRHFIAAKQFPSETKASKHSFAEDLMNFLEDA